MEYLITYGLALFVILIVLAILVAIVLPSLQPPEVCQFTQPGFSCSNRPHAIIADSSNNVRVVFALSNEQGRAIKDVSVLCTSDPAGNVDTSHPAGFTPISPSVIASGQEVEVEVDCKDGSGQPVILSPGSNFRGTIAIKYKFTDDLSGAPERLAKATISGAVQAG